MHGRLKIKTTAQQEAEKQTERQAKLAGYRNAMSTILSRRKEGHKDEMQLKITAQVLLSNPDIHTLWNIRRECVLAMLELNQSQDKAEEVGDKEDNDSVWMKEVELTGQCLLTNPKSYGAWHHRSFSLDQMRLVLLTISYRLRMSALRE